MTVLILFSPDIIIEKKKSLPPWLPKEFKQQNSCPQMLLIDQMYTNLGKKAIHIMPYPSIGPKFFWVNPKSFAQFKSFSYW